MNLNRARNTMAPREQGVSLVDLLVGLGVGLLVSVAALGSLVQSRLASAAVNEGHRLQQDASTALRILGHQLRAAGAPVLVDAPGGKVLVQQDVDDNPGGAIGGTDGDMHGSDTLSVAYRADAGVDARDCLGQSPAGPVVRSSFRLAGQELQCLGSAARPTFQALVSGVEDFQVGFGVQAGHTLQYRPASAVSDWSTVVSVQVCLVLVGNQRSNPASSTPAQGCREASVSAQDGRLRRVFRQVFSLQRVSVAAP
jgi:type IV pilus assembly protein PilW